MRLPSSLSSPNDANVPPRLPLAGRIDQYRPLDIESSNHQIKPGCIFCSVSKENGFGVVFENEELIAFHDRTPRAKVHLLIIPRYHVADSVKSLTIDHIPLLDRMTAFARTLLRTLDPSNTTPKLGFHIPPFSSVPHLHLHVLVPPYTFLGSMKYPISQRHGGDHGGSTGGVSSAGNRSKGWSWFVEAGQAREILNRGGQVKLGRS